MGDNNNNDANVSLVSNEGSAGDEGGASLIPDALNLEGFDLSTTAGLRGAFQSVFTRLSTVETRLSTVENEIKGIRAAMAPAVVYSLLETSVNQIMEKLNTQYTFLHRATIGKVMEKAVQFANWALSRMLGVTTNAWNMRKKVCLEEQTLYREALTGLQVFLQNVPKIHVKNWPPERNTVAHNGMLLKSLYSNVRVATSPSLVGSTEIPERVVVAAVDAMVDFDGGMASVDNCRAILDSDFLEGDVTVEDDAAQAVTDAIDNGTVA